MTRTIYKDWSTVLEYFVRRCCYDDRHPCCVEMAISDMGRVPAGPVSVYCIGCRFQVLVSRNIILEISLHTSINIWNNVHLLFLKLCSLHDLNASKLWNTLLWFLGRLLRQNADVLLQMCPGQHTSHHWIPDHNLLESYDLDNVLPLMYLCTVSVHKIWIHGKVLKVSKSLSLKV